MLILQCRKCHSVIISTHLYDYVGCECGAIAIDGGNVCPRQIGHLEDMIRVAPTSLLNYVNEKQLADPEMII